MRAFIPAIIRRHLHFIIVTTVLTLVMTYPTIVYVFRTDVFWVPGGLKSDVYTKFWDIWYGKQILTGNADRLFTDLIFYPDGVSLAYHPLFFLHSVVVNVLNLWMPISNAYSLTFLLIVFTSTLAGYIYILWLLKDKWPALFGAVIFGFCSQVIGYPTWPEVAWIAPMPLIIYCIHRGTVEKRASLLLLAGLFIGLTSDITTYVFVCVLITVGLFVSGLGASRWRDKVFWRHVTLLVTVCALSCAWRVIPMLQDTEQINRATTLAGTTNARSDLISFLVNDGNPILGPLVSGVFQISEDTPISAKSYLGFVSLTLIGIGLLNKSTRRKMLPWLGLLFVFLVLCLGAVPSINGTALESIKLPKHYLNQLLPSIFAAFYHLNFFMAGAWLPLAVLSCYGLLAIRKRNPIAARPAFILALILIVAFEFYRPIKQSAEPFWSDVATEKRVVFLDWLKREEANEIRLINLPFGWHSSRIYSFYQSISGYPQTEGAISRTPSRAYNYIRANYLLNAWYSQRPIHCEMIERDSYLSGLKQLEDVGFSHIVYHRGLFGAAKISETFRGVNASYSDDFVSIYRLSDLRNSCPDEPSARQLFTLGYADALEKSAILAERRGTIVVLPPTRQVGDHFMLYLRRFSHFENTVVTIVSDDQAIIDIQSSKSRTADSYADLERKSAVWLVNHSPELNVAPFAENQAWFLTRFKFCQRFREDERTTVDLYLKLDIPCSASDETSEFDVRYDGGVRLHNASFEIDADAVRFYLAWTRESERKYSFSIQFFDEYGEKALQHDKVIGHELLDVHEIDTTMLQEGTYSVKLIVYDFETQISQGGTVSNTNERFERELEIAKTDL